MCNSISVEIRNANAIGDFGNKMFNMDERPLVFYLCSHNSTAKSVSMVYRAKMYLNIHY